MNELFQKNAIQAVVQSDWSEGKTVYSFVNNAVTSLYDNKTHYCEPCKDVLNELFKPASIYYNDRTFPPELYDELTKEEVSWHSIPALVTNLSEYKSSIFYIEYENKISLFMPAVFWEKNNYSAFSFFRTSGSQTTATIKPNFCITPFNKEKSDDFTERTGSCILDATKNVLKQLDKNKELNVYILYLSSGCGFYNEFEKGYSEEEVERYINGVYNRILLDKEYENFPTNYLLNFETSSIMPTNLMILFNNNEGIRYIRRPKNITAIEYILNSRLFMDLFHSNTLLSVLNNYIVVTQTYNHGKWSIWYKDNEDNVKKLKQHLHKKLHTPAFHTFLEGLYKNVQVIPEDLDDPFETVSLDYLSVYDSESYDEHKKVYL